MPKKPTRVGDLIKAKEIQREDVVAAISALLGTGVILCVHVEIETGAADATCLLEHATAESTTSNSVARSVPVGVEST